MRTVIRVFLSLFLCCLGCFLSSLLSESSYRIDIKRTQSGLGISNHRLAYIAFLESVIYKFFSTKIDRIDAAVLLFGLGNHSRFPGKGDLGKRIHIMDPAGQRKDIPGGITDLGIAQHFHVGSIPVKEKTVAPSFLIFRHHMDIVSEEECLNSPVVPSPVR